MVGNGTISYDHERDGRATELGGCNAMVRNLKHDTFLFIRYVRRRLTVRSPDNIIAVFTGCGLARLFICLSFCKGYDWHRWSAWMEGLPGHPGCAASSGLLLRRLGHHRRPVRWSKILGAASVENIPHWMNDWFLFTFAWSLLRNKLLIM